ncbi:MAG TPA: ribonuclease III [Candidatus Limnocylindria bacterium]|nr:ribonuclease III [Candidatus Limnocylindria bacterium]
MTEPSLDELSERLGIPLTDTDTIRQAFVHSSYLNENPAAVSGHNERLEFLGDAVIGVVVARLLYDRFPDDDEGLLTARRAALVNRDSLAAVAREAGLDRYLLLGRGEAEYGGRSRPSLLAASFEALIGAIVLSDGLDAATAALHRLFADRLAALRAVPLKSAKSQLQEWSQRHRGAKPSYQLLRTTGPAHDQRFQVAVSLGGQAIAEGEGASRQRAEEQAAARALLSLRPAAVGGLGLPGEEPMPAGGGR